jgi:hypothetical protein
MDNRALDDSCRLAADIGDTHAASWLITSAVLLAAVLAVFQRPKPRLWPLSWSPSARAVVMFEHEYALCSRIHHAGTCRASAQVLKAAA